MNITRKQLILVVIAALGYFVDIYDLTLFGIVRKPSLLELGVAENDLRIVGSYLFNWQMAGMLLGGLIFGIFGDIKGRVSVLFGSIFLYSSANILNGMVQTIDQYAALRFIAGIGLAGELGAGITLVSESMHKDKRGWGTMVIVTFGALGAVLASIIGDKFPWRISYYIGGGLGLALLVLRVGTFESGMFEQVKSSGIQRGAFHRIFLDWKRSFKYLACVLIGVPIWYIIGILIIFSPELSKAMGVAGNVAAPKAVMFAYLGLSAGDFLSGILSQLFKSRKLVILGFILFSSACIAYYLLVPNMSLDTFYFMCFMLGTSTGYWALFATVAAEQFGTNIRATVATTVPNFVRGSAVLLTSGFNALVPGWGLLAAAGILGIISMGVAFLGTLSISETFGKDLDYVEEL